MGFGIVLRVILIFGYGDVGFRVLGFLIKFDVFCLGVRCFR